MRMEKRRKVNKVRHNGEFLIRKKFTGIEKKGEKSQYYIIRISKRQKQNYEIQ
jgi:hypothetical protein